jgi:hypothetical protein
VWRFGILQIGTQSMGYEEAHSTAALTLASVKTLPIHLSRMLLPLGPTYPELNPYLVSYVSRPLTDPLTYVAIAVLVALGAVALRWRKWPEPAFWILFFLVCLSPLLKVDDIGGTLDTDVILAQERWIYLPSLAVFALLAQGVVAVAKRLVTRGLPVQRLAAAGLALVVMTALGISSAVHAGRHEDPFALLKRLYLIPEERLGRMQHANRLILYANLVALPMGDLEDAETRVRQAIDLVPDSPLVGLNTARVLAERGKWEEVLTVLSPWLAPTQAELEGYHRTNFRVLDDLNRTGPEIPVLLARAEAHLGRGEAALSLLCEGERRQAPAPRLEAVRREVESLLGPEMVASAPRCSI